MSTPEQRAALYQEWLFGVTMKRWEHLKDELAKARKRHSGQGRAAKALREFTTTLLVQGV